MAKVSEDLEHELIVDSLHELMVQVRARGEARRGRGAGSDQLAEPRGAS